MRLLFIPFLLTTLTSFGQVDYWESWNSKYHEVDVTAMLRHELSYADSINKDSNAVKFYARQKGYRFQGTYTGNWRPLTNERRNVMKATFKLFGGTNPIFDQTKDEVEIQIESQTMWLPIQSELVKAFKEEIQNGTEVYLYCMFFNHHKYDGKLYNIFFISEFRGL